MPQHSARAIARIQRTVLALHRTNSRLRTDLRVCRRLLMDALVQRGTPSPMRARYSRRAVQYALLMVGDLESLCDRKHDYYNRLLTAPEALEQLPRDVEALEHALVARFDKPRFIDQRDDQPSWVHSALHAVRRLARRLLSSPAAAFLRRVGQIELFARHGTQALMTRALDLAQAFERRTAYCHNEWERERVRQDIIAEAGSRFDPVMVGALLRLWTSVTRFAASRGAVAA